MKKNDFLGLGMVSALALSSLVMSTPQAHAASARPSCKDHRAELNEAFNADFLRKESPVIEQALRKAYQASGITVDGMTFEHEAPVLSKPTRNNDRTYLYSMKITTQVRGVSDPIRVVTEIDLNSDEPTPYSEQDNAGRDSLGRNVPATTLRCDMTLYVQSSYFYDSKMTITNAETGNLISSVSPKDYIYQANIVLPIQK